MKNLIKILILFVCLTLVAGCAKVAQTDDKSDDIVDGKMTAPFDVKLSIHGKPSLNNEVTFTAEILPKKNIGNVGFEFNLPEGFILTAGNLNWSGSIKKNQPLKKTISAKAIRTGQYMVTAFARQFNPAGWSGDADGFYISVGEDSANVSKEPLLEKLPPMDERVGETKVSFD